MSNQKVHKHIFVAITLAAVVILQGCSSGNLPAAPSSSASEETLGGILSGGELSEQQWREVLMKAKPSVYKVVIESCYFDATGSGFFVGDTFLTNRHVVEDAESMHLESSSGLKIEVESWGQSKDTDIAWIKTTSTRPALSVAPTTALPGDLVANLGFPLGGDLTEERGRLVRLVADAVEGYSVGDLLGVTSEALPGNSGGPLLDRNGQVIGIVVALDTSRNLILAVPREDVKSFLEDPPAAKKPKKCD